VDLAALHEVIVIGAGPAGLAAAIQLKRYALQPLILERGSPGGLLRNANLVENYPGFPAGISGVDIVHLFQEQARSAGVSVTAGEVIRLDHTGEQYLVDTLGRSYISKVVVIATGTRARQLMVPQLPDDVNELVFDEVYPLLGEHGRHIAIIGAGDAAFDYALNLSRSNQVTILNRRSQIKCLPLLWDRALEKETISYLARHQITEISRVGKNRLKLSFHHPGGSGALHADYLIAAIGREPRLDFLDLGLRSRLDELRREGSLYLIGDVKNDIFRQTSIAVGDGVRAAMEINMYINGKR
jgi:thioredoxin reductase